MVIFVYKPNNKKSLQLLEKSKNYFYRLRVLFIISSMSAIEDKYLLKINVIISSKAS